MSKNIQNFDHRYISGHVLLCIQNCHLNSNSSHCGPGGPLAPQYLSDQLTLFEPGRANYPHLLLLAPPMFFTFRHHCDLSNRNNVVFSYYITYTIYYIQQYTLSSALIPQTAQQQYYTRRKRPRKLLFLPLLSCQIFFPLPHTCHNRFTCADSRLSDSHYISINFSY